LRLIDALQQARRVSRGEAQRENQKRYYVRNKERINMRGRNAKLETLGGSYATD